MDPILELARKYNLIVIEDATESLGAQYKGQKVGHIGDIACFSFNGNKLITTGGGGMIVTDRTDWAARAKYLTTQAKDDPIEFVHGEIGYNYRLTNIQAAMGCAQLELLEDCISRKRLIADRYAQILRNVPGVTVMPQAPWAFSVYWMYTILIEPVQNGLDSREMLKALQAAQIQTRPLWQPIHLSPAHTQAYATPCPVAEHLNQIALSLPCSVGLSSGDQEKVIATVVSLGKQTVEGTR
jgi:perosamine synthetase